MSLQTEKNQNQTVAELALKSAEPQQTTAQLPDGTSRELLLISKNLEVVEVDKYMERPSRINASEKLNHPKGFVDYVNDFKGESSCIFGFPDSSTPLVAALDYHGKDNPSWCEHRCQLDLATTVPWQKWTDAENRPMSHREFTNFIQDNIEDVQSPEHAKLIEAIMQFESDLKVKAKSEVAGHGQKSTVASEFKTSDIPEIIRVGLAPYRYVKHYEALVRITVTESEKGLAFKISITNKDRILEKVFDDLVEIAQTETDLKVYV